MPHADYYYAVAAIDATLMLQLIIFFSPLMTIAEMPPLLAVFIDYGLIEVITLRWIYLLLAVYAYYYHYADIYYAYFHCRCHYDYVY